MLGSAISQILGERADAQLARDVKATVCSFPEVKGAYDLVLNNYGPDRFNGSIHIELPDDCTLNRADDLIREITSEVYQKHGIILTAISIYSINSEDKELVSLRKGIAEVISDNPYILGMHALSIQRESNTVRVDFVVSLDAKDRAGVFAQAVSAVEKRFPEYNFYAVMDTDFSEG